jgi:hypothetical protein
VTQEPPRLPPQSAIQATGQVAGDVVSGLKQQPMLLAIVALNLVAIVAAVWFLRDLNASSREFRNSLIQIVSKCINHGGSP